MKTVRTVLLIVIVLGIATAGFARKVPKSYILNSAHDFTVSGTFESGAELSTNSKCNICHIAHKFNGTGGPGRLLWNHTISNQTSYGTYSNPESLNATVADLGDSNHENNFNVSNLCLSCHDGTVAIADTYTDLRGTNWSKTATLTKNPGSTMMPEEATLNDLARTHPVNFTYDAALANTDGGLAVPTDLLAVDTEREIPLFDGKVQCASCHDAHNGSGHFVRSVTNAPGGRYCLKCHL